jgi:hypothetical protein
MSDDVQDFVDRASQFQGSAPQPTSMKEAAVSEDSQVKKDEDKKDPGQISQWARYGSGYAGAASTVQQLPPDIYSIQIVQSTLVLEPKKVSTDALLKLPDSRSDQLIKEVEKFWGLKEQFRNGNDSVHGGYLHKRGYMLFGPPGSGKTSTIKMLMNEIVKRGGIVLMGDTRPQWVGQAMELVSKIEPEKGMIVVFEDFDNLINMHGEAHYLSMLDGEDSVDNVLFLATTNYPERLDPRIYNRPGRFSDVVKIGMPNKEARRMFLQGKMKKHDEIEKIVELTDGFSIDHLKSVILGVFLEGKPLEKEINRLRKLFIKPDGVDQKQRGLGFNAVEVED